MVNDQKGIFYCFGCRVGGDAINFVAKMENCSPIQAAYQLAERYQIALPADINQRSDHNSDEDKNKYQLVGDAVARWCHQHLLKAPLVLDYVKRRGFDASSLNLFSVGYFPGGMTIARQLIQDLKPEHILVDDLLQAGIISASKNGYFSPFEDRIIFPIYDHLGRFCGFGGRIFKEHDQRSKYYNSKENEYFSKGTLLFGLDKAKRAIQTKGTAFLVEGYTDCLAMVQHGYTNTVATLGTACTRAHLKQLSRYASELIVLYDGDAAGQNAILRLTELCWEVNMDLSVASLPAGQDPASLLAQRHDINAYIQNTKEIFTFYIDSVGSHFEKLPLSQKMRATNELLSRLKTVDNSIKQDILLQRASQALRIPFETLKQELGEPQGLEQHARQSTAAAQAELPVAENENPILPLEKKIFCAIMNRIDLFDINNEHIIRIIDYLPSPLSTILSSLQEHVLQGREPKFVCFFDTLNDTSKQYVSGLLLEQTEIVDEKTFSLLLFQLQKKRWREMAHTFKLLLEKAKRDGDDEKVQRILHDFITLQQAMSVSLPHDYA